MLMKMPTSMLSPLEAVIARKLMAVRRLSCALKVGGAPDPLVSRAIPELHRHHPVAIPPVRVPRPQRLAVFLESALLDRPAAGRAIVVVEAVALVLPAVSAIDADVGGATVIGVEI